MMTDEELDRELDREIAEEQKYRLREQRKRDRFTAAVAVMQGLVINGKGGVTDSPRISIMAADALLDELDKDKEKHHD